MCVFNIQKSQYFIFNNTFSVIFTLKRKNNRLI